MPGRVRSTLLPVGLKKLRQNFTLITCDIFDEGEDTDEECTQDVQQHATTSEVEVQSIVFEVMVNCRANLISKMICETNKVKLFLFVENIVVETLEK